MGVAPEAGRDEILVNLRFLSEAEKTLPRLALFLLPQQPAPEIILREFILADAVALNETFCELERHAWAFTVHADVRDIALVAKSNAENAVAAQLVGFQLVDVAGGEARYVEAQAFEQLVEEAVELEADAAAVVHDDLLKHILALERGDFAVHAVEIFVGNVF